MGLLEKWRRWVLAFVSGTGIGALGGLIGLGGAEFRLPLLLGAFAFGPLEAVILNKTMSLVVVTVALPARAATVPWHDVAAHWQIVAILLCGTVVGAWYGATLATRIHSRRLYQVMAVLLVFVAAVLLFGHGIRVQQALMNGPLLVVAGVVAGFGIGIFAALLGVAGGELLIPTIVVLFGVDIRLAGSLSLLISIPTMLVAFSRYSRDGSFAVVSKERFFIIVMAAGSVVGSWVGGKALGIIPSSILLPALSLILVLSAFKVWQHSVPGEGDLTRASSGQRKVEST